MHPEDSHFKPPMVGPTSADSVSVSCQGGVASVCFLLVVIEGPQEGQTFPCSLGILEKTLVNLSFAWLLLSDRGAESDVAASWDGDPGISLLRCNSHWRPGGPARLLVS